MVCTVDSIAVPQMGKRGSQEKRSPIPSFPQLSFLNLNSYQGFLAFGGPEQSGNDP